MAKKKTANLLPKLTEIEQDIYTQSGRPWPHSTVRSSWPATRLNRLARLSRNKHPHLQK
jgi:hypothetical protein